MIKALIELLENKPFPPAADRILNHFLQLVGRRTLERDNFLVINSI